MEASSLRWHVEVAFVLTVVVAILGLVMAGLGFGELVSGHGSASTWTLGRSALLLSAIPLLYCVVAAAIAWVRTRDAVAVFLAGILVLLLLGGLAMRLLA